MPNWTPAELLALGALSRLGARVIEPEAGDSGFTWCPSCGTAVTPYPDGRVPLCYPCTVTELGYDAHDIAVCRAHRISMKRWLTMESELDLPLVNPKVWRKRHGR